MKRLVTLALMTASLASAQSDPRSSLIVNAAWLNQHIHDADIVLLHIGEKAEYDKTHIPGARFLDFHAIHTMDDKPGAATLDMLAPDSLRAVLAKAGVSDRSRIVVYYGSGWVSPATRVMFTLDHAGLGPRASLLDGGMPAWVNAGGKPTDAATEEKAGTLSALKVKDDIVTGEWVRDNIGKPGIVVVDARAAGFYDGVMEGGPMDAKKKGHIPGALSVPYATVINGQNEWLSPTQLAEIFTKAGVKKGDTVVGYCHIGQQATAMLFAARSLGFTVKLYDGSFEDWARKGWPVEIKK